MIHGSQQLEAGFGIAVTRKQEVRADPVDDRLPHVRVVLPEPFQDGKPADPHGGLAGARSAQRRVTELSAKASD